MPSDPFSLTGQTALITGASSGLGRHFAHTLARAGARVALAARRVDALQAVAKEIAALGGHAYPVRMDVCAADEVASAIAQVEREFAAIDILVNNSGIAAAQPMLELTEGDWDRVLDTNLKGAYLVSREVALRMSERNAGGSIVNIASILAFRQQPHTAAYGASKAGLVQLTKIMALELARHRIRVNAIAPGYFATELSGEFVTSSAGEAMIKRIPQRRLGETQELDGPLLLLCSAAGSYITGTVIVVDGGHLLSSL